MASPFFHRHFPPEGVKMLLLSQKLVTRPLTKSVKPLTLTNMRIKCRVSHQLHAARLPFVEEGGLFVFVFAAPDLRNGGEEA